MDISRKLADTYMVGGKTYPLNLAFNNVLKVFELMWDDSIDEVNRLFSALRMLLGEEFKESFTLDQCVDVYTDIFETHIDPQDDDSNVIRDIKGNIIPQEIIDKGKEDDDRKPLYDIRYDGEYIYASFLQAYGIDLFDEQNKMHWHKFNALLSGLPSDTKFAEVLRIRSWKPTKGESSEYKKEMRRLQSIYRLPS